MIRTKHVAVFFALVIVGLILVLLFLGKGNVENVFSAAPPGQALVINALTDEVSYPVTVVRDTTREETRASLIAQLGDYTPPPEPEPEPEPAQEPEPEAVPVTEEPRPHTPVFCSGEGYGSGGATWDGITALMSEGGRLIRSLEENEDGSPLHWFQVPAMPRVTGSEGCLSKGMVGIALDGRVISAAAPFVAQPDGLVGYALDGFGIFGMYEGETFVAESSLDACHGHIHPIIWDEALVSMYHYHVTESSPYTLGCFRGVPATPQ